MSEDNKVIRKFETGATRDTSTGKLDYEAFMSPIVIKAYAEYLNKHRVASDGSLREGDNWQKLFGPDHYAVCMKSGWRHFMDWWLYQRGFKASESIDDALAALIFNASAYWFKLLTEREKKNKPCPKCDYIHLTVTSPCGPQPNESESEMQKEMRRR